MDIKQQKQRIQEIVVKPMLSMMQGFEGDSSLEWDSYTEEDVADCQEILEAYVDSLAALDHPTDKAIMDVVKKVVLALNAWNEPNDFIETEEREWLWEFIQKCAADCGLKDAPDDVTEAWREW